MRAGEALEPRQERAVATRRRLLDAAVEELVEAGYGRLTTARVALRAGVTRGAQQHHFLTKEDLVAQAIRHLGRRQANHLTERIAGLEGADRVQQALDCLFEAYRGQLFHAYLELALAARTDPQLQVSVRELEATARGTIQDVAEQIFGARAADEGFEERWALVLSTMRGVATLALMGHDEISVERQWGHARRWLLPVLEEG